MLFPPSGGLHSIKAAQSVKISMLLGGCFFFSLAPLEGFIAPKGCLRGESCAAGCPTSALFLLLSLQNACIWKSMVFPAVWRGFLSLHPTADLRHSAVAAGGLFAPPQLLSDWGYSVLLAGTGEQHGCQTELEQFSSPCIRTAVTILAAVLLGRSERQTFWVSRELSTLSPLLWSWQGGRSIFFLVGLLLRRPACQMHLRIFWDMCIPLQTRAGWSSHTCQMQRLSTTFLLICIFGWWPCWFPEPLSPFAETVLAAKHPHMLSFTRHSAWILLFTKSNVKSLEKWRHPFRSIFGHVKSHHPTRTCPTYLSCLPYAGHTDTFHHVRVACASAACWKCGCRGAQHLLPAAHLQGVTLWDWRKWKLEANWRKGQRS